MKTGLWIIFLFIFAIAYAHGQAVRILVVDIGSSKPIENVTIKGGKFAAKTDANGYFLFNGPDRDSLKFTHVNYQPITVSLDRVLHDKTIRMTRKENVLETVMINTGYQKIDQRISSGAVDKVDLTRTQDVYGSNIFQKLKGNSPILFDNAGKDKRSMTIRGLSSINNSSVPLIVLDNFPYEGDPGWINPEDIEDVTILKDAAAAAIWGSRAGNGVIVITTKKGKYNMANKVTLSSAVQVQGKPDLYYPNQISSAGVVELETFLFNQGAYDIDNPFTKPWRSPIIRHLRAIRDGVGDAAEHQRAIEEYKKLDVRKDYEKYMYRTSFNQNHNLSIEGGTKNLRYQLSGRMDNNIGTLDDRQRKNLIRSFVEIDLHPRVRLSTDLQYVNNKTENGRTAYVATGRPYLMLADANGKPLRQANNNEDYLDTLGQGLLKDWFRYPLTDYQKEHMSFNSNMLLANVAADIKLLDGLSLRGNYGYQFVSAKTKKMYEENSYVVRNLINTFAVIDYTNQSVKSAIPTGSILDQTDGAEKTHNLRFGLSYEKKWRDFLLTALLGTEWRESKNEISNYRDYGFDPDTYVTTKVDYVNAYTDFISKGMIYVPYVDYRTLKVNRFKSQYANASISYQGRYVLTGSVRRDASNLFGVKTNERWQPLWSVGYKWNLSEEQFFKIPHLDALSIRGSYGVSGNVDQSRSAITTIRYMGTDRVTNYPFAYISQFSNPDLRWEKSTTWNTGVDFSLLMGKLTGSFDYYKKWGDDLFGTAPVDYTAIPSTGVLRNIASMKGDGAEIRLNAAIPIGKRILLSPQFMLNIANSKVTDYHFPGDYAYQFTSSGAVINGQVGYPVYSILTYRWKGLDAAGNPLGELNGEVSTDYKNIRLQDKSTLEYKGTVMPRYSGYLNPAVSIGDFDLMISFLYKFGHVFMRKTVGYGELVAMGGLGDGSGDYDRRWKESGDELKTDVPSFIYPIDPERNSFYSGSSVLVENASHIRLQNISLGYKFNFQKKVSGRVFCNASDLGLVWKKNKKNIDPDYLSELKPQKLLSMGIRLTY